MPALSYFLNTKRVDTGANTRSSKRQIARPNSNSEPLISTQDDPESDDESDAEDKDDDGAQPKMTTVPVELTPTTTLIGQTTITIRVSLSTLPQPEATAVTTTTSESAAETTPTSLPAESPSPSPSSIDVTESPVPTPSSSPQPESPAPPTNNEGSVPPVLSPSGSSTDPLLPVATGDGGVVFSGQGSNAPSTSGSISSANKGLPTGAIVGIVIGIVAVLLLAAVFLIRKTLLKRRRTHSTEDAIQWPEEKTFGDRFVAGGVTGGAGAGGGGGGGGKARGTITPYPFTASSNAVMSSGPVPLTRPQQLQPQMNIQRVPPPPLITTPIVQQPPQQPPYYVSPVGSDSSPIDLPNPYAAPRPPTQINRALPKPQTALDTHTVRSTFVPTLPDELNIVAGEKVRVLSVYDDGWALCERYGASSPNGGPEGNVEKGMVPMECLMADESMLNTVENKRASSLRNVA